MKQTCGNCKWGKFKLFTNHATPRPKGGGICEWPDPVTVFPLAITNRYELRGKSPLKKDSVWSALEGCPTWESKPMVILEEAKP